MSESKMMRATKKSGATPIAMLTEEVWDSSLHSKAVLEEMAWLRSILEFRIANLHDPSPAELPAPPALEEGAYADFVKSYNLDWHDRILLMIALLPHLAPTVLDGALIHHEKRHLILYPDFGGYVDKDFYTYRPTLQTVIYMLAGSNHEDWLYWSVAIHSKSILLKEQVVYLDGHIWREGNSNLLQHSVLVQVEHVRLLLTGQQPAPDFGVDFPASIVETSLTWDHLVLPESTRTRINRVLKWIEHRKDLHASDDGMFSPSFPCLFYGSPGTGKTLTAKLIGKTFGRPVFRIDLSMMVSKYIGETEKNLAKLFNRAEGKDWILFFDEADALFGKRTEIRDSNDKWANLEVSYLLQKMEEHRGLVILATNLKDNLDSALTRRFQAIVQFPKPGKDEQRVLWNLLLPAKFKYDEKVDLDGYLGHSFTGANIANILKQACLDAVAEGDHMVMREYIASAIREELRKENRTR